MTTQPHSTLLPLTIRLFQGLKKSLALILLFLGCLASAQKAQASTTREFNDAFTGTSLSSSWSTTVGGSSGSSQTVSNGLSLATTAASNMSWIATSWSNYSLGSSTYGNTPLLFQATMGTPTWPTTKTGSGFSVFLASGTGCTPTSSTVDPTTTATNILELRYTANSDGSTGTLALYGKTSAAGSAPTLLDTVATSLTLTPQNVALALSNMSGATYVTIPYGNASPSQPATSTASYTLSTAYGTAFQSGQPVYLYVMARSGTGGALTMVMNQVSASSGFVDNFPGTAPSQNYWSTYSYGGTGAGDGASGSSTAVGSNTLTLNANAGTRWIGLAPTVFSLSDYATETFQTTVKSLSSAVQGSGFSIILASSAPQAMTNPVSTSSNALELRFVVNSDGNTGVLSLWGKLSGGAETQISDPTANGTNDVKLTGATFNSPTGSEGLSTMGITFATSSSGVTTATIFFNNPTTREPSSETIVLPSTYTSAFSTNPLYAYLMTQAASTGTESGVFSQFTEQTQPVLSATVVVNKATQLQNIALGGDYAKGQLSPGVNYSMDNAGSYMLANVPPTWARVCLPLYAWEPANQNITSSNIGTLIGTGGYLANQDTGNLHCIFQRIQALETSSFGGTGPVTNFVFSVWQIPSWMTDGTNYGTASSPIYKIPSDNTDQGYVMSGIASFLLYAHNKYGLDLTHTYISFNEPDFGVMQLIVPGDYANMVYLSEGAAGTTGIFHTLGVTGVSGFPSTIPWVVGETNTAQGYSFGPPVNQITGSAIWNGYSGSYTNNVLTALTTDEGGTLATGNLCIGFHSYDDAPPQIMSYISQEGAHYGIPIICDEVGTNQFYDALADQGGTEWNTYVPQTWDNAWKMADNYQKVLNYAGVSAAMLYEFMNDRAVTNNSSTVTPYLAYYEVQQMYKGFSNIAVLSSTPYGQIDALAGGHANNPHSVQILQPDSRPLNVQITGLYPTSVGAAATYNVYSLNSSSATAGSTLIGTYTADSTGTITINIPAAPTETLTAPGPTYWDSGSIIMVTDRY